MECLAIEGRGLRDEYKLEISARDRFGREGVVAGEICAMGLVG